MVLAILTIAAIVTAIIMCISWFVHISMVKDDSHRPYGYAGYRTFKKEFDKHNWADEGMSSSLFDRVNGGYWHASIIRMNNIGMIMRTPWDWIAACLYVRQYRKKKYPKQMYNWEGSSQVSVPQPVVTEPKTITPDVMFQDLKRKKKQ